MSREKEIIEKTGKIPVTPASLAEDLKALGVKEGMSLLVHSSLSAIGWVCGGAQGVIQALMDVLTEEGTLVMPAHSAGLSDPVRWENPPVPPEWVEVIRRETPAYRKDLSPTRGIGVLPEVFRKMDGVLRSNHPLYSFCAWGREKEFISGDTPLGEAMGNRSPLGRVYERGGYVLMIGTDYDTNSSIHLAEYRTDYPAKKIIPQGAPCLVDGRREWVTWEDLEYDTDYFPALGEAWEKKGLVVRGKIGLAESRFMPQRELVDFACEWIREK